MGKSNLKAEEEAVRNLHARLLELGERVGFLTMRPPVQVLTPLSEETDTGAQSSETKGPCAQSSKGITTLLSAYRQEVLRDARRSIKDAQVFDQSSRRGS